MNLNSNIRKEGFDILRLTKEKIVNVFLYWEKVAGFFFPPS